MPTFAGVKEGILGDVLGARSRAESTAQRREVREQFWIFGINSISYPHEQVGSLHIYKRA
jgi:hypothetical protein